MRQNTFFLRGKSNTVTEMTPSKTSEGKSIVPYLFSIVAWRTWQANFTLKHRFVTSAV